MLTDTRTGHGRGVSGDSVSPLAAVHKALSEATLGRVFGRLSWTKLHQGPQVA